MIRVLWMVVVFVIANTFGLSTAFEFMCAKDTLIAFGGLLAVMLFISVDIVIIKLWYEWLKKPRKGV